MAAVTKNQKRKQRIQNKKASASKQDEDFERLIAEEQSKNVEITEQTEPKTQTNEQTTQANEQTTQAPNGQPTVTREQVIAKAEQMWSDVKKYIKDHPEFKEMKDKDRLDLFRTKMGYGPFMDEFPIVGRYMICLVQFNVKAFIRFLDKCAKVKHPPPNQREKGYMEDQWIRRQADYVQYLWEAYQKRHFNNAERQWIWQNTYKLLKGEFDDFRNKHKEIEERVKEEKKELLAKNAVELLQRLTTGKQHLTEAEEQELLDSLQDLVYKKNFSSVLRTLTDVTKQIPAAAEGVGTATEQQQKITMIETVDVNRMNEVDDKYKPAALRGMEPVLDEEENATYEEIDTEVPAGPA